MTYIPAFLVEEHGAVRRPWKIEAKTNEQAVDVALRQARQAGWRLVQVTRWFDGASVFRN